MKCQFEEKQYEQHLNNELLARQESALRPWPSSRRAAWVRRCGILDKSPFLDAVRGLPILPVLSSALVASQATGRPTPYRMVGCS